MAKEKTRHRSLADPADLAPLDEDGRIQVVIETPKGSRNKYAFDHDQRVFALTRVFPAGMAFPYDFGFVPSTKAEDGDPTDVLVLMDEQAFPGCLLRCRIIGVIEGLHGKKKNGERNDRLIAIEEANHSFAHVRHVNELWREIPPGAGGIFRQLSRVAGQKVQNSRR